MTNAPYEVKVSLTHTPHTSATSRRSMRQTAPVSVADEDLSSYILFSPAPLPVSVLWGPVCGCVNTSVVGVVLQTELREEVWGPHSVEAVPPVESVVPFLPQEGEREDVQMHHKGISADASVFS